MVPPRCVARRLAISFSTVARAAVSGRMARPQPRFGPFALLPSAFCVASLGEFSGFGSVIVALVHSLSPRFGL